ncbi:hypothetical protein DBT_1484 [Dissulfuribacter thermophilus]|uniref:Protein translocase subunit SecE n=1 Tax=Dissulfuribacter thermophilus TaxID=1156395 RepID=A0A1B9F4Z0_9BACT|nr:hypothetical protein DBT_1484 [Dissulfuribacter thermophilus]
MAKKKAQRKDRVEGAEAAGAVKAQGASWINDFVRYLKEVRVEFDKITWANKKETVGITVAVLAITFFFAAYLGLVDFGLTQVLNLLY